LFSVLYSCIDKYGSPTIFFQKGGCGDVYQALNMPPLLKDELITLSLTQKPFPSKYRIIKFIVILIYKFLRQK